MGCKCGNAKEWLLGYAGAVCAAGRADIPIVPLFVYPLDKLRGATDDTCLTAVPCPSQCAQSECNEIFNDFDQLCRACTDDHCRAQVQAAYEAAIQTCTPVGS